MNKLFHCLSSLLLVLIPLGLAAQPRFVVPPLPEEPMVFTTAEGHDIKVVVLAKGLNHPWGMAILPDGSVLFSERNAGKLRIIRNDVLDPEAVMGVPELELGGYSGLFDIVLHPDFEQNKLIYFSYSKVLADSEGAIAIAKARWDGKALQDSKDIFVTQPGIGNGARIAFDAQGLLYFTTFGGMENDAQNPGNHFRKVLRITDEGEIPADNPFIGVANALPEVYTLGHRSILGITLHTETDEMWQLEMGPNGGDEVNVLKAGSNYGWPLVSLGRSYPGPWRADHFQLEGYVDPVIYWTPSISVSGMSFYSGDKFPAWQGNLFVGGMRFGEIEGTGRLERIHFNEDMEELRRETLLTDLHRRIRDVRQGPNGYIYLATDEEDGAILRIEPYSGAE